MVRAVRDGAVCMVNPFRCKILHKKASLAVLSDERNAGLFTDDEPRRIADAHPVDPRGGRARTEFTESRRSTWCRSCSRANRDRLVLKPNDDYGGKGIVLGWEVDDSSLGGGACGRRSSRPYIVQERIVLPTEPYPSVVDGEVEILDRMFDTAPFVAHGEFGGRLPDPPFDDGPAQRHRRRRLDRPDLRGRSRGNSQRDSP